MRVSTRLCTAATALALLTCGDPPEIIRPPSPRQCVPYDLAQSSGAIEMREVLTATPDELLRRPTDMRVLPDGRAFVVSQYGYVYVAPSLTEDAALTLWLDISARVESRAACCNEEGLYSIAFHPDFARNGELFVIYTQKTVVFVSDTVISRFKVPDPPNGAPDPNSEEVLVRVQQPSPVHNGGQLRFGPDGYLYFSLGDGGGGGDPNKNGQNKGNLFGAISRIDVNGSGDTRPYRIPTDNPFVDDPEATPELYAYGFRNPWRIAFDPTTGELWAGDVGERSWEEVNLVEPGGNHGWSNLEGPRCHHPEPEIGCDPADYVEPAYAYDRLVGRSVTLGLVYDGDAVPELQGTLLFADFGLGTIWTLLADDGSYRAETILESGIQISSFAEDLAGEPYVLDWSSGAIYKLVPSASAPGSSPWAPRLSDTGCFESLEEHRFTRDVFAYDVNAPLWSDGARKSRGLVIPEGAQAVRADDHYSSWDVPVGTVAIKTFWSGETPLETRFLVRADESRWMGATYEWRDDRSDGVLLTEGGSRESPAWDYPSRSQCLSCHTRAASRLLGITTAQLNGASGRDQLRRLGLFGYLDDPPAESASLPRYAGLADERASTELRARAYLDANCAHCHRPGGPTPTALDLRFATPLATTNACDVAPGRGTLGIEDARIIAPGASERSVLLARMATTEPTLAMPPLGRRLPDTAGTAIVTRWIQELTTCD